jgi:hypothetical protein
MSGLLIQMWRHSRPHSTVLLKSRVKYYGAVNSFKLYIRTTFNGLVWKPRHNSFPVSWCCLTALHSILVNVNVTCASLQITFCDTNGYKLQPQPYFTLITALIPRSGFALESPWKGWAQVRFFWSNRCRAHHDVVRKYDDSDVEMLWHLSQLYLRLDNFQGFLVLLNLILDTSDD